MKKLLLILSLIWSIFLVGRAQPEIIDIDLKAVTDVTILSQQITKSAKTDLEKVTNIYQWLIKNINYDQKAYKNGNRRINRSNADILKRKKAICWGYASLFKAMCEAVNIPCEVISGYGKTTIGQVPDLESPNHAWNAVKIDSNWRLLDATWDSGTIGNMSLFEQKFGYTYFLPPANYFIVNHLPANPDWQLLDCPISTVDYRLTADKIVALAAKTDCEKDNELPQFERLNIHEKRITTATKAYQYNPTKANERELAYAQLDYEAYLTEIAERLQVAKNYDSLLIVQSAMMQLCETAEALTELYDTQLENCAYNFFNYAVALTQKTSNDRQSSLENWQAVLAYLKKAAARLEKLPQNMFTKNALANCANYIQYAEENIVALK
ncbi:MAG: transglutaminase domain-containing protein [Bacteroidota bacterium]